MVELEQELAESGRRTSKSESLRAELGQAREEESDSLLTGESVGDYTVRGSGPTSTWYNASRSSRNSAATPDVQVSTINSEWERAHGLDFSSRGSARSSGVE